MTHSVSWLNDHRAKAIALRERLYQQAESRYQAFYNRVLYALQSQRVQLRETTTGILTLSICPTYPNKPYQSPSQLTTIHPKIWVPDYYMTDQMFPPQNALSHTTQPTIVQDGVVLVSYTPHAERVRYTEVNSFGLYFYRQQLKRVTPTMQEDTKELLSAGEMLTRMDEFIDSAGKLYREIGFWGYLELRAVLMKIREIGLTFDWLANYSPSGFSPDDEVAFTKTLLANSLETEKEQILRETIQNISWTFGLDFALPDMEAFNKRVKK